MLIDTHCHLTSSMMPPATEVLAEASHAGVGRVITVATDVEDARAALPILANDSSVYLCAGIHPHEAGKLTDDGWQALVDLHHGRWGDVPHERVVAVGEMGLDYHYDFAPRDVQEQVFRAQIQLALDVDRPIVIHAREAEQRVLEILREYPALDGRFVFHCYSGDERMAQAIFDLGGHVSFTGVVTFRKATQIQAAARVAPLDRFMVETDAPYMSPEPVRKIRPCVPALVTHTAAFIADQRGMSLDAVAAATTANAERFFGLPSAAHTENEDAA